MSSDEQFIIIGKQLRLIDCSTDKQLVSFAEPEHDLLRGRAGLALLSLL